MGKKKSNNSQYIRTDIDYDKLAEAIVKAHQKVQDIEEKCAERKDKEERKEWQKTIGYIEYPETEKGFLKKWHSMRNDWAVFCSAMTFKAEYAKKPRVAFELMRLATSSLYRLCEILLYILGLAIMFVAVCAATISPIGFACIPIGTIAWFFARIVRIAKLEVENITDKDILNTLFGANMTFLGVILAMVAIVIEVI